MIKKIVLVMATLLSGCGSIFKEIGKPDSTYVGGGEVQIASTNQFLDSSDDIFDDKTLFYMVDPLEQTMSTKSFIASIGTPYAEPNLQKALYNANVNYPKTLRNTVTDRMMMSAENRCNIYFTYLKRMSTNTNAVFGTLTTILGGVGAIVTGETASRIFSGAAGISSGTRAELNQAIFQSTSTSVIIPGIKAVRKEMRAEIDAKKSKETSEYSVQAAIADVIRYNGECSLDTGLAYAQKSMILYGDVGIDAYTESQRKLALAKSKTNVLTMDEIESPVFISSTVEPMKTVVNATVDGLQDSVPAEKALKAQATALVAELESTYKPKAAAYDAAIKEGYVAFSQASGTKQEEVLMDYNSQLKNAQVLKNTYDGKVNRLKQDVANYKKPKS